MNAKPIYKKTYSRRAILAIIEMWYRAETINEKKWTKEKQPFLPYIIFKKKGALVDVYYDKQGLNWTEKLIVQQAKNNPDFIKTIATNYREKIASVSKYHHKVLTRRDLAGFFKEFEEAWLWFDAAWWFWEMTQEEEKSAGLILPESFKQLREQTEDFIGLCEEMIECSLKEIYPNISRFVDVLRLEEVIKNEIPDETELKKRKKGYFFTNNQLFTNFTRAEIEKKFDLEFEKLKINRHLKQFSGCIASRGLASGKVKLVFLPQDLDKVKKGDILVSPMTSPDFLSGIKKAAAIITDEGGILCHAAIVSREFGIPCITGTKIATKVLKDGDMVEVDANNGIVKIVERAK